MRKLIMHNLGPIDDCELNYKPFTIITGWQASGKSTIAKALYYFRTVKDDMLEVISSMLPLRPKHDKSLVNVLRDIMRKKFLRMFGFSLRELSLGMEIQYFYSEDYVITVRLVTAEATDKKTLNIEFNTPLTEAISDYEKRVVFETEQMLTKKTFASIVNDVNQIFGDDYYTVYLPSGRSTLSFISNYMRPFNFQGDAGLDYCTEKYMDDISAIKTELTGGLDGLIDYYYGEENNIPKSWEKARELIGRVLCGTYRIDNGEERIVLDSGKYVRINFASSGQQDALWITNLLFYYLVTNRPTMFIIEEPESRLFPPSQKYITELISLVCNQGHSVLVTTHSPYILGSLNNLLYASSFRLKDKSTREEASKIIPSSLWLDYDKCQALFVKEGKIEDCMDHDIKLIQNERIDEISITINNDYDKLFDLMYKDTEEADAD